MTDDKDLLEMARCGDGAAFEAVYRAHHAVVLTFLSRRVNKPDVAGDLLAETFAALLILVRDEQRPLPEATLPWLLGTARHLVIDSYRRGRVEATARARLQMEPIVLDDEDLSRIEEVSAATDLLAALEQALPPDQLEAVRARIIDERDYATIAQDLRCSEAVIRKRVSRGLGTLRRQLLEAHRHD